MKLKRIGPALLYLFMLAGCGIAPSLPASGPVSMPASPTSQPATHSAPAVRTLPPESSSADVTLTPTQPVPPAGEAFDTPASSGSAAESATPIPPPTQTLSPDFWQSLPVIPAVSDTARKIYQRGLELGNNPRAFSKIGDCGSTPSWFLGDFDRGPRFYSLGNYQDLQGVIQEFQGSFDRTSLAAKSGFNASSVLAPLWADHSQCEANETPLACEYRVNRPIIAFIMLGTNDIWHPEAFEPNMRIIIELSIQNGVVPILSTKADDREGDGSVNATIARLADEYQLPLWNFWRAVQPLPDHGLQPDGAHITWASNRFDDPQTMKKGWPVRNLTALQALDAVWRGLTGESAAR
jgi:hypothetical protein